MSLFFSAHNTCEINILSDDGSTKPFIDVSSMIPLAKHFNQHGEFILGLREQDPALPSTQFSNRKVANFGKDNKLKFQVEFDKIGTQLFSYIWRITTDSKDNMYAIVNDIDDGRIEALNKFGELNFIYAGDSSVNSTENPFRPKNVVATQSDNILFTEQYNHTLHLINIKGKVIALQNTKTHGIKLHLSLCFYSEGFLFIGCNSYKKDKHDSKIHVVKKSVWNMFNK